MADWDFTYAVARIRALESGLLSDSDVEAMTALKNEEQVIAFLKEKGWGDEESDDADAILEAETAKTSALVGELKVDPKVFEIFSYPELYHNLKAAIKTVCTESEHPGVFYDIPGFSSERMLEIVRNKEFNELPDHMRKAAEEAYETLLHTRDGQLCDIIIDRAVLDATYKEGLKSKEKIIKDYAKMFVAVSDIRIAARGCKTGKSREFLQRALAPCDAISTEALMNAASSSNEAVIEYLQSTEYAGAAAALEESPSAFERWCDNQIIKTIEPQKYVTCSAGPIVAYYLARQNEIKMARIILTVKANELPDSVIRERARKMYV